jgi:hypothetical protein
VTGAWLPVGAHRPVPNEFRQSSSPSWRSSTTAWRHRELAGAQWSTDPPSAILPDESDIQIVNAEGEFVARRTALTRLNVAYRHSICRRMQSHAEEWGWSGLTGSGARIREVA